MTPSTLEIWSVGTFPLHDMPAKLVDSIEDKGRLVILEEHYRAGGLAEALSYLLLTAGVRCRALVSLHAAGYPTGRYGSQRWHLMESGLAGPTLVSRLEELVRV